MTDYEEWIETGAALDAARRWLTDDHLLDLYLKQAVAFDDYDEWCRDQQEQAAEQRQA